MYLDHSTYEGLLCTLGQFVHRYTKDSIAPSHPHSLTQVIPHHQIQSLVSTR